MASKRTAVVGVRLSKEVIAQLDDIVAWSEHSRRGEPYTRSTLVAKAIADFLAHRKRAKGRGPKDGQKGPP